LRVMKQKGRAFRGAAFLESWPMLGMCAAGAREFRIAAELGFKTAVTTRPGVLFKAHRDYLTALPRISVKGQFQQQRALRDQQPDRQLNGRRLLDQI